ncbi:MAG: transposase zinc-binding domain-containing protein [Saprospiraceae bacterium]|nr:transposase zinc-binding domain-containing protein [Saprospiraceae bacterium]
MIQNQIEISRLLQQKIFSHPSIVRFNSYSRAVFDKLSKCHTSQIGVHQYRCNNTNCNHVHYQYHSCGNRHCPTCGGMRREAWIEDRMSGAAYTIFPYSIYIATRIAKHHDGKSEVDV